MPRRAQPDYYVGRPVVGVNVVDVDSDEIDWGVVMDGNVQIFNSDPERLMSEEELNKLESTVLLRVIRSEDETRLQFGYPGVGDAPAEIVQELAFNPTQYMIADKNYNEGHPEAPQRTDDHDEFLTPDMPEDRLQEGPENPEEEADGTPEEEA
jgi:hypothetical protein